MARSFDNLDDGGAVGHDVDQNFCPAGWTGTAATGWSLRGRTKLASSSSTNSDSLNQYWLIFAFLGSEGVSTMGRTLHGKPFVSNDPKFDNATSF